MSKYDNTGNINMINQAILRLSLSIPALLATTQANAHTGEHTQTTLLQALSHIVSSPFHAGLFLGIAVTLAFIFRKAPKSND
jgi:hypothetical protein